MPRLSAFIITKNEAHDIGGCLDSLQGLADEVVVVDAHSTDGTPALCASRGARVLSRDFDHFSAQKQFALEQTTHPWVFSIDADERVTPALAVEIRKLLQSDPPAHGYQVRRHLYFLGRRLRFGGVGADWVLRLFHRGHGAFRPVSVHESVEVEGRVRRLASPLLHFSFPTLDEYAAKSQQYIHLSAKELYARGRRFTVWSHLRPLGELLSRVVIKGAWLDGQAGLMYAALSAHTAWLRAIKLWELEQAARRQTHGQ